MAQSARATSTVWLQSVISISLPLLECACSGGRWRPEGVIDGRGISARVARQVLMHTTPKNQQASVLALGEREWGDGAGAPPETIRFVAVASARPVARADWSDRRILRG